VTYENKLCNCGRRKGKRSDKLASPGVCVLLTFFCKLSLIDRLIISIHNQLAALHKFLRVCLFLKESKRIRGISSLDELATSVKKS
jgi:hypothetical protein